MPVQMNIGLVDHLEALPEPMKEARFAFTRSVMTGTLEPELIEYVRLRSASINGCNFCLAQGVADDLKTAQISDPEEAEGLSEREKLGIMLVDRVFLDPESFDDAFFERLREHFTVSEIFELAYAAKWLGMLHSLNELFDVQASENDVDVVNELVYGHPSVDQSHPYLVRRAAAEKA